MLSGVFGKSASKVTPVDEGGGGGGKTSSESTKSSEGLLLETSNETAEPYERNIRFTKTSRRISTAAEVRYPMEMISFDKFLKYYGPGGTKTRLEPHQVLKERGDLVTWEDICDDEEATIIFVSHEWLAWDHPDKDSIQTHTLCEALSRLKEGKVDAVTMSQLHQLAYKENVKTTAKEWSRILKNVYLWFDWLSMPQPGAEKTKERRDALKQGGSDAIRSIPAYVERSDFMVILAPYGVHENRKSRAYYRTWRRRGWCVCELFASVFSRDSKYPNLLIRSAKGMPQWIPPLDALMLSCGNCDFSCCERNHVSTTATDEAKGIKINEPIPCDKPVVYEILSTLLDKKIAHLKEEKKMTLARSFSCMRPWWLRNLTDRKSSEGVVVWPENATDLDAFKATLWWSSKMGWFDDGGVPLLMYAVGANNLEATKAVLEAMRESFGSDTKGLLEEIDRPIPKKGVVEAGWPGLATALHAAMSAASPKVVSCLLEYGADPKVVTVNDTDPFMMAGIFGRIDNIGTWLRCFPKHNISRGIKLNGARAIYQSAHFGPKKFATVQRLIDAGADPKCLHHRGGSLLISTTGNEDCDLELLELLLKLCTRSEINHRFVARSMKWRIINFISIASYRLGLSRSGLFGMIAKVVGYTALHNAVERGNVEAVEALLNAGADPKIRTALGEDAFALERAHGPFPKIAELLHGSLSS
eukprot:g4862.t1